ncbi:MAG: virulence factor [Candidatus Nanopelagicaceae bacterium]|nr:virulence factor [Candidatus Nanopelagicaceae bacterium]
MSEYQIMRWHEIPSMVVAREGTEVIKILLPSRFQEAIDEAAMRMGEIEADAYTNGWIRDPWVESDQSPQVLADTIASDLEEKYSETQILKILDSLGSK